MLCGSVSRRTALAQAKRGLQQESAPISNASIMAGGAPVSDRLWSLDILTVSACRRRFENSPAVTAGVELASRKSRWDG